MNLLLDTHAFITLVNDPGELPERSRVALEDENNLVLLSLVSPWEMQIKVALGKLDLGRPPSEVVRLEADKGAIAVLPVSLAHINELASLPPIHHDPFDRMLVAQARHEGLTLVTGDANVRRYPVECLWD